MNTAKYLLLPLMLSAATAEAALIAPGVHCVGTDSELQTALTIAKGEAAALPKAKASILIKSKGTPYVMPAQGAAYYDDIELKGGYSGAACADRIPNAQDTVIDFANASLTFRHRLAIDALTITGDRIELTQEGSPPETPTLEVRSSIFRTTQVSAPSQDYIPAGVSVTTLGVDDASHFRVLFAGNVFETHDPHDYGEGWCALKVWHSEYDTTATELVMANNTIVKSANQGVCLERVSTASFINNIIRDAPKGSVVDLWPGPEETSIAIFDSNNLENGTALPGLIVPVGTTTMDPQFVSASDYRLKVTSPLINAGSPAATPHLLPYDAAGQPRTVGILPDVGAYESAEDDSDSVIWVTTAADSGPGSLRQAIIDANNADNLPQTIRFEYNTSSQNCGVTHLMSPLPDITDSLTIDGYAAPDGALVGYATPNSADHGINAVHCVHLYGLSLSHALRVPAGAAGAGVKLVIDGVRFSGFGDAASGLGDAVKLEGGANHVITGSAFRAVTGAPNARSILVGDTVSGVRIGGESLAERNLISADSSSVAVRILGDKNTVLDNLIGPGWSGSIEANSGNARGVWLQGDENVVQGNTISGNTEQGVILNGNGNIVLFNTIGPTDRGHCLPAGCLPKAPNGTGIMVFGDGNFVHSNWVAYNNGRGIAVANGAIGNSFQANRIGGNGGLGIDLANDNLPAEPQVPDFTELASAANEGQNFPTLHAASGPSMQGNDLATGSVQGELRSENGTYTVQIFASATCDDAGHGEGEERVGEAKVTIANASAIFDGLAAFTIPVTSRNELIGRHITATARRDATGSTSEFSQCFEFTQANSAPVFEHQTLVFPHDGPIGTSRSLAAEDDGLPTPPGSLTFLVEGPADPAFSVAPDGVVTQTIPLPFALEASYGMAVKVTDGEYSVTRNITILPERLFRDGFE